MVRTSTIFELQALQTWAQFHKACKHKNLLSMKFLPWHKQDYQPNFHVILWISKQQLNTSNKHCATNVNLVGNPVFYQGKNFMLSKFVCLAALWNWVLSKRVEPCNWLIRSGKVDPEETGVNAMLDQTQQSNVVISGFARIRGCFAWFKFGSELDQTLVQTQHKILIKMLDLYSPL